MNNLDYFVGKGCSIITHSINKDFTKEEWNDYFVGRIDAIDEIGILMTHLFTGCKNYFFIKNVIAIIEEQTLHPANPDHAKVIDELNSKKNISTKLPSQNNSAFVDIQSLASLAKKSTIN